MLRRDALKNTALIAGAGISIGSLTALIQGCKTALPAGNYLTGEQLSLLELVVDTFLPRTDTPSATDAGVHTFIDENMEASFRPEELETFTGALDLVAKRCKDKYGKSYDKITQEEREELLLSMHGTDLQAFEALRGTTLYVYYTSEEGATKALNFLPIPGEYIGCIPVEDVGTAWAL